MPFDDTPVLTFWSDSPLDQIARIGRGLQWADLTDTAVVLATDDPVLVRYLFKPCCDILVCERGELGDAHITDAEPMTPLYEAAPAAAMVRVTPRTVRNWITAGKVTPHYSKRERRLYVDLDEMKRARR